MLCRTQRTRTAGPSPGWPAPPPAARSVHSVVARLASANRWYTAAASPPPWLPTAAADASGSPAGCAAVAPLRGEPTGEPTSPGTQAGCAQGQSGGASSPSAAAGAAPGERGPPGLTVMRSSVSDWKSVPLFTTGVPCGCTAAATVQEGQIMGVCVQGGGGGGGAAGGEQQRQRCRRGRKRASQEIGGGGGAGGKCPQGSL
jgi:hypothetical protein